VSLRVIVNPAAEADLKAEYAWCEGRRAGQGADFLLCVEEVFERIGRQPEWYGEEFEELRVAPLRRHQYAVAYRIDAAQVTVVAVYHLGSDPSRWQSRA
jgi:plasmid stabilization system protein ParE